LKALCIRQPQWPAFELRFQNLILDFEILDCRLLLPIQPAGEDHHQK